MLALTSSPLKTHARCACGGRQDSAHWHRPVRGVVIGPRVMLHAAGRAPMLRSRVWRRQTFTPMARVEVPQVMRSYHRLYTDVDDDLLHYLDDNLWTIAAA